MRRQQDVRRTGLEHSIIDLAVEIWRLMRLFDRVLTNLDAGEASRYTGQLRYVQKRVEESLAAAGFRTVNIEGQPFDAGMAASALNLADFSAEDELLVDHMIEPIIMGPDGVEKEGTIMLRKAQV